MSLTIEKKSGSYWLCKACDACGNVHEQRLCSADPQSTSELVSALAVHYAMGGHLLSFHRAKERVGCICPACIRKHSELSIKAVAALAAAAVGKEESGA